MSLDNKCQQITDTLGNSTDLIIRQLVIGHKGQIKAAAIYLDGLIDKQLINSVMDALLLWAREVDLDGASPSEQKWPQLLSDYTVPNSNIVLSDDWDHLYAAILDGATGLLIDEYEQFILLDTKGGETRAVTEPSTQSVVRGPHEGFTEALRANTAMVRRKIKNKDLWMETRQIGQVTQTDVALMYIKGIADNKLVQEVRDRLDRIDIDSILESSYIEEMIQDTAFTPFPTIMNSERPDVVAAGLLEGRVVVIIDGTPFSLLMPAFFIQFLQSAEDYYHRSDFGLIRILRYLALIIAMLGPAFYIAVTTFHQEMLPTPLLISLAAQREGIPFPAFVEAMLMEITFEILREAGVRMPRAIGQAVSIVGALVLGDAAVQAGLVSPAMVIVVSLTAIANFTIPAFDMGITIRTIRFAFMLFAASFGLFGITLGIIALFLHLCSLRSFGVPYMSPLAPFSLKDQKDTILRLPLWSMRTRPRFLAKADRKRTKSPHDDKI